MRFLLLAAIRFYQRWLSPRKGFSCAYRLQTGRASCSTLGYRAVRRFGVREGWGVLQLRFGECAAANRRRNRSLLRKSPEAGDCDLPSCDCDLPSVDLPDCDLKSWNCDLLSSLGDCGSCGGEGSERKKKKGKVEPAAEPAAEE